MSMAKVRASNMPDVSEFEQHPFDNLITKAVGKEPYISFTRSNDMPWYQLFKPIEQLGSDRMSKSLKVESGAINGSEKQCNSITLPSDSPSGKFGGASTNISRSAGESSLKIPEAVVAFAQASTKTNDLSGWPLLSSSKIQPQKCVKCSREIWSTVNYKRHIRTHRKSSISEKGYSKTRELLAAFWDKISVDEARELVTFKDPHLKLEGVASTKIISELSSWIRKPGFSCLPQVYVKAGMTLLDIIEAKSSNFPISSSQLFSILDDASEKTFLHCGTASSLQKFLFDGDVAKIALDVKNLVACASFLFELKMVNAWLADKDAEALRCQKLLVEEEEAAQKRQAELTERRRRKKQRQKEQKAKDMVDESSAPKDLEVACQGTSFVDSSTPRAVSDVELDSEASSASSQPSMTSPVIDLTVETNEQPYFLNGQNIDQQALLANAQCEAKAVSNLRNPFSGFHSCLVAGAMPSPTENTYAKKNPKGMASSGGQKVWTRKSKQDSQMNTDVQLPSEDRMMENLKQTENSALLIGSIPVSLGDSRNSQLDLHGKSDLNSNRLIVKFWRPVSRQEGLKDYPSCPSVKSEIGDANSLEIVGASCEVRSSPLAENSGPTYRGDEFGIMTTSMLGNSELSAPQPFSSQIVDAFLKQRWDDAIKSEHTQLILTSDEELDDYLDIQAPQCSGRGSSNAMPPLVQQGCMEESQKIEGMPKSEKVCNVGYIPGKKRT